jgi:hypothetical protein
VFRRERITRVYSVLKEVVIKESRETLREKFGYHDFVVTTAGRLVPWKGMKALVDASGVAPQKRNSSNLWKSLEMV